MKNLNEVGFKYAIGDVVIHKGIAGVQPPDEKDKEWGNIRSKVTTANCVRFVIVERIAQECHGGVQLLYMATAVTHEGHISTPHKFAEFELIPLPGSELAAQHGGR